MHDRHGAALAHGDLVLIPAKIVGTSTQDEFCNIVCETIVPMHPTDQYTMLSLNARQVERAGKGYATATRVLEDTTDTLDASVAIGASGVDTSEGDES